MLLLDIYFYLASFILHTMIFYIVAHQLAIVLLARSPDVYIVRSRADRVTMICGYIHGVIVLDWDTCKKVKFNHIAHNLLPIKRKRDSTSCRNYKEGLCEFFDKIYCISMCVTIYYIAHSKCAKLTNVIKYILNLHGGD